jgi:hypothetical protein
VMPRLANRSNRSLVRERDANQELRYLRGLPSNTSASQHLKLGRSLSIGELFFGQRRVLVNISAN